MPRKDKKFLGRSKLIPYIPGEVAIKRHSRRLAINISYWEVFHDYLHRHNFNCSQSQDQEHWTIYNGKEYYEFWPRSAKLIRNRKYRHGIHSHDILQVLEVIFKKPFTLTDLIQGK